MGKPVKALKTSEKRKAGESDKDFIKRARKALHGADLPLTCPPGFQEK